MMGFKLVHVISMTLKKLYPVPKQKKYGLRGQDKNIKKLNIFFFQNYLFL
jgi:hypothetical protein